MVTLCIFGWIYSKFPPSWYEPTNVGVMAVMAAMQYFLAGILLISFPPIGLIASSALICAYIKRPEQANCRHLLLLIPLAAALPYCLWGGYWEQHQGISTSPLPGWMVEVDQELVGLTMSSLALSALYVVFSKRWKGERYFGLSLLTAECTYLACLLFMLSLEMLPKIPLQQ